MVVWYAGSAKIDVVSKHIGGALAQWVESWISNQQVVGSNPTRGKAA